MAGKFSLRDLMNSQSAAPATEGARAAILSPGAGNSWNILQIPLDQIVPNQRNEYEIGRAHV